jgi:hypothetical protein
MRLDTVGMAFYGILPVRSRVCVFFDFLPLDALAAPKAAAVVLPRIHLVLVPYR